jgi:hypothetical protein
MGFPTMSHLVIQTHQESILKPFRLSSSDVLVSIPSSAILESPNEQESQ